MTREQKKRLGGRKIVLCGGSSLSVLQSKMRRRWKYDGENNDNKKKKILKYQKKFQKVYNKKY